MIDKITILEIKNQRFTDERKLAHIHEELSALIAARDKVLAQSVCCRQVAGRVSMVDRLSQLTAELKAVNVSLWKVEEALRGLERAGDFSHGFVELARSVYRFNDHRAALKRQVSELLNSPFTEQKSYPAYQ